MREGSGIAVAIAVMLVSFFATLAAVLVVLTYLFLTAYAIVEIVGDAGPPSARVVLIGVVAIVGTLAVLLSAGIALIGRPLSPKRPES